MKSTMTLTPSTPDVQLKHVRSVETDVNFNLCLFVGELYDGDGGLISGVNGVLDSNVCLL